MKNKQDIVKSNALIEAIHRPGSVYHMRLFLAALLQVKAKEAIDSDRIYEVSAEMLAKLVGNKTVDNYANLEQAAEQLSSTSVKLSCDYQGNPIPKGGWLKINLVSSCCYKPHEGRVELRFTKEITPYISELRARFTRYDAKHVMPMRSGYGIRLYELCLQWLGDERVFSVEDFRKLFELDKKYPLLYELKRNVIEPALKDINTHSDIRVRFSQRKAGRVVTHFVFTITKLSAQENSIEVLAFEPWVNRFGLAKNKGYQNWAEARKALGRQYAAYKRNPTQWLAKNAPASNPRKPPN